MYLEVLLSKSLFYNLFTPLRYQLQFYFLSLHFAKGYHVVRNIVKIIFR